MMASVLRDVDCAAFDDRNALRQASLPGQDTLLFSAGPVNRRVWRCDEKAVLAGRCRLATADMSEGFGAIGRGSGVSGAAEERRIAMMGVVRVGAVLMFCGLCHPPKIINFQQNTHLSSRALKVGSLPISKLDWVHICPHIILLVLHDH